MLCVHSRVIFFRSRSWETAITDNQACEYAKRYCRSNNQYNKRNIWWILHQDLVSIGTYFTEFDDSQSVNCLIWSCQIVNNAVEAKKLFPLAKLVVVFIIFIYVLTDREEIIGVVKNGYFCNSMVNIPLDIHISDMFIWFQLRCSTSASIPNLCQWYGRGPSIITWSVVLVWNSQFKLNTLESSIVSFASFNWF